MSGTVVERRGLGSTRTVVRLMIGLVRRNRAVMLPWLWMVPMLTRMLAKEGGSVTWLMAASISVGFTLSGTGEAVGCREHRVLPVTDRELWVARWLNATLVVPLWLLLLESLGLALAAGGGTTLMSPETLLLSTLYVAVYAGATVALPLLMPYATRAVGRRIDKVSLPVGSPQRKAAGRLIVISVFTLVPLYYLMGIGGPLLFAKRIPIHLSGFSTTSAVLLIIGLAMSIAALIWTPPRGGTPPIQRLASAVPASPAPPKPSDRLTGVLTIIWSHMRSTFVFTAVVIAAAMATVPFLPPRDSNPRFVTGMMLIFMLMGISMFSVWTPWARRLKILPLSVKQVTALFVLTPIVTWMEIWLMVLFVHVVMQLPINVELSPVAILAYAGLCAVGHALGLWLMGSVIGQTVASMAALLSASGAAIVLFEKPNQWTQVWLLLIGLASLAVAALISHRVLTRSTSSARAYRSPGLSMKP